MLARLFLILLISFSLCLVSLCPEARAEVQKQGSHSSLHAQIHDDSQVPPHEHEEDEGEHIHRHSHGPGQPEHEHHHDHSSSLDPNISLLFTANLYRHLTRDPEAYFHRFATISVKRSMSGFPKAVFRPPITLV